MKKIVICLMSLILAVCSLSAPVGAAAVDNGQVVQPMWDNTRIVDVSVGYINGVGTAYSMVLGEFEVTSITTDIYVYRVSGNSLIYINENHETVYDFTSATTCDYMAVKGVTYRIEYTFTVRMNGVNEVIRRNIYNTYRSDDI